MRFFAHDGKTTHGPAEVEELLKLPGFDGDTLVCPVGSADSADWKAALAYPPLKQALLTAQAPPVPIPSPLPPVPKIKTSPCRICAHLNPEDARYCSACGARTDGTTEPLAPVQQSEPFASLPADDPFGPLDVSSRFPIQPSTPLPMPAPEPAPIHKPPQLGKMGQLAAFEETDSLPLPPLAPSPVSEVLISQPSISPPAKVSKNGKSAAIAAIALAAFVASALAWKKFAPAPPRKIIAALKPSAPIPPAPAPPAPKTIAAPAPALPSAPRALVKPPRPARRLPPTVKIPEKAKRKRSRKARTRKPEKTAAAAKKKEPAADSVDPQLEALLSNAAPAVTAEDAAKAAPANEGKPPTSTPPPAKKNTAKEPKRFSLPGLDRPVSAGARKPQRMDSEPNPTAPAEAQAAKTPAPASASAAAPAETDQPAEGDQLALVQVKEQFDFCTQLLAQSAYGDHYDTCLCKDARKAAGQRGAYVARVKKSASAGKLENAAKITSSSLAGGTATVIAHWRVLPNEFGRDLTQTWRLEDGLWCRAP